MGQAPAFHQDPVFPMNVGGSAEAHVSVLSRPIAHSSQDVADSAANNVAASRHLDRNEFFRRLWHFGPGILALILSQAPALDAVSRIAVFCIVTGGIAIAAAAAWFQKSFSRPGEKSGLPGILGYTSPILITLCLFPDFPELALTLLAIIAFGDGSATLFGLLYGSARLPWNAQKTWVGVLAFVAVSFPMGSFVYFYTASPRVAPEVAFLCVGTAAVFATAVESLPLRGNDNFRVGIAAMAGLVLTHACLVGF